MREFKSYVYSLIPYGVVLVNKRLQGGYPLRVNAHHAAEYLDSSRIDDTKVYLRPMSSMTEEEDKEWQYYKNKIAESCDELLEERISDCHDFFNSHYFDYRGLIEKGLALVAPEGMYKIKD